MQNFNWKHDISKVSINYYCDTTNFVTAKQMIIPKSYVYIKEKQFSTILSTFIMASPNRVCLGKLICVSVFSSIMGIIIVATRKCLDN